MQADNYPPQQTLLLLFSSLNTTEARIEELKWVLNAGLCKREKRIALEQKLSRLHDTRQRVLAGIDMLVESPNGQEEYQSRDLEGFTGILSRYPRLTE